MADTIRSLVELNALFADQSQAAITPQDLRDLVVSMMVHGEIGSGAKAATTLASGWQAVDLTEAGAVGRGLTVDPANRRLTDVPVDMKALVSVEVAFRGALNTTYDFAVWRNTHSTPVQETRLTRSLRVLNTAQVVTHSWATSLQLQAGDSLQLGVRPASGTPTFELLFGVLRVQRIGVE